MNYIFLAASATGGWARLQQRLYDAVIYDDRWKMYLEGLARTLQIAVVACVLGVLLGIIVAMVKTAAQDSKNPVLRVFNFVCNVYTTIIRGTPQVLQLLIIYTMAIMPNGLIASFIGFGINSGAYLSETFRSGIQSVDTGQMEAARSLGLSRGKAMINVVLPQAIKNMLPAIFNEFIMLVKDTSIAGYIAVNELTKLSNQIRNRTYDSITLFIAGAIYLLLTFILTLALNKLERRYAISDRNRQSRKKIRRADGSG